MSINILYIVLYNYDSNNNDIIKFKLSIILYHELVIHLINHLYLCYISGNMLWDVVPSKYTCTSYLAFINSDVYV